MNKRNISKVIVFVVALIVLSCSVTYAYFTAVITGTPSNTSLTAGNIDIDTNLDSVSVINNPKLLFINSGEQATKANNVSFYLKNTSNSTVKTTYNVYLKDINITKNLYSSYLKWELLKNGKVIYNGTFATATRKGTATAGEASNVSTTANDITLTTNAIELGINSRDDLVFRMWLENDPLHEQSSLLNGSFSGRLYVDVAPVSAQS